MTFTARQDNSTISGLDDLVAAGIDTVVGSLVNPAGLSLAKAVPTIRIGAFAYPGLGASPLWHTFTIDQVGMVFTPDFTAVGDQRVRLDVDALRVIGDGLAWGPLAIYDQDGDPDPACSRGALQRIESRLAAAGFDALVGHELEFLLVAPDGGRLSTDAWAQYGLSGLLEHEAFVRDVIVDCHRAGVAIEQFHPEYGGNQFEMSFCPDRPTAAADQLMAARIVVSRVARRHGLRVSLSPVPFADSVGSGSHQHFSLRHAADGRPLFSEGDHPLGLTPEGQSAIAGVLEGLPEAQALLCGSIVSGLRTLPGHWAGAYACWGTENREASIRFVEGGPANPLGGNVEVKVIDPSANPYLATATVLGLALDGVRRSASLPAEVVVDPSTMTEEQRRAAGVVLLPNDQSQALRRLADSTLLRDILGNRAVDAVLAVREYEQSEYRELDPARLAAKFRLAWSL